jgi:putative hydrolase
MMIMDLHMHSNFSDGLNTPEEMIEAAVQIGCQAVAITDHVRETSSWLPEYARHLKELREKYKRDISVYSGIEAKVLTLEGTIDADPSFYPLVDLVLGSIHRIPKRQGFYSKENAARLSKKQIAEHWLAAFSGMLDNPRVDIIAHPLSELQGFGIEQVQLPIAEIADRIAASGKILEFNVRYNSPDEPVIRLAAERDVPFVVSSDSHSVTDLIKNSSLVKEMFGRGLPLVDIGNYMLEKKQGRSDK